MDARIEERAEEWRAIAGAPGYEVSNLGRVRSFRGTHGPRATPFVLKPDRRKGCLVVTLCLGSQGKKSRSIHRMVLEAFQGPCPQNCECCHNDGKFENNRIENLRWASSRA